MNYFHSRQNPRRGLELAESCRAGPLGVRGTTDMQIDFAGLSIIKIGIYVNISSLEYLSVVLFVFITVMLAVHRKQVSQPAKPMFLLLFVL